jgi:oligosaccharide repeat unit polymerase
MSLFLVFIFTFLGIIVGKFIFRKWINHLTLYCLIMGSITFFYELKLLPYPDLTPLTWFIIFSSTLSFYLGIMTYKSARNLRSKTELFSKRENIFLPILADGGKVLKYSILFFSFVGLFVAIQRWWVLIHMFGSIPAVLLNAGVVYRLNVNREIKEFIPILPNFVYVAVFLVGIYTAYRRRFSFLTFFPFIGIILKELTYFGRGEILFSLMEFLFSFFLFRHFLSNDLSQRFKFSKRNAILASTLLIALLVSSASLIRVSRGNYESYVGTSTTLKKLKENFIISPSIYLYFSSEVGILNKYLESKGENIRFGENTFLLIYNTIADLEKEKRPEFFQKGYYIPMWTNTGTYLREWHADFGIAGVFLGPYLLGLFITWLWFKFYEEKNLIVLVFLVYFYVLIGHTFLMMITRLNQWYFSIVILIFYIPLMEKMAMRKKDKNLSRESV